MIGWKPGAQSDTTALRQVLLWQDPDADFLRFGFSLAREKMLDSFSIPAPEPERSPAERSAQVERAAAETAVLKP